MRAIDPALLKDAVDHVRSGCSARESGRRVGITHHSVRAACQRAGVELRTTRAVTAGEAERVDAPPHVGGAPAGSTVPALPPAAADWQGRGLEWDGVDVRRGSRFLAGAALGMSLADAAEYAGLSGETLATWLGKAREGDPVWAAWRLLVGEAQGDGHAELLRIIRSGRPGWQSAAWLLERGRPQSYGRRLEVVQEARDPLEHATDEALYGAIEVWRRALAKKPGAQDG